MEKEVTFFFTLRIVPERKQNFAKKKKYFYFIRGKERNRWQRNGSRLRNVLAYRGFREASLRFANVYISTVKGDSAGRRGAHRGRVFTDFLGAGRGGCETRTCTGTRYGARRLRRVSGYLLRRYRPAGGHAGHVIRLSFRIPRGSDLRGGWHPGDDIIVPARLRNQPEKRQYNY